VIPHGVIERRWPVLKHLAQRFKDHIADQSGDESDEEVGACNDVVEGEGQGLAVPAGNGKLTHQQIGIEEKDDERNLDDGAEGAGGGAAIS